MGSSECADYGSMCFVVLAELSVVDGDAVVLFAVASSDAVSVAVLLCVYVRFFRARLRDGLYGSDVEID